jgi:hypothetical protein
VLAASATMSGLQRGGRQRRARSVEPALRRALTDRGPFATSIMPTGARWRMSSSATHKARAALVPAMIDDVRPPLGFRQRQVANLAGRRGDGRDPDFLSLISAIDRLAPRPLNAGGRAENPPPPVAPERSDKSPYAKGPLAQQSGNCRRGAPSSCQRLRSL